MPNIAAITQHHQHVQPPVAQPPQQPQQQQPQQQESASLWPEGLDSIVMKLDPVDRREILSLFRRKSILEDQLPAASDTAAGTSDREFTMRRQVADLQARIDELTHKAHGTSAGNKRGGPNIIGAKASSKMSGFKKLFGGSKGSK